MNDNTMCIRMEDGKFQYAYELPEDYDYEVVECNESSIHYETCNDNYLRKKIGKIKNKVIKIVMCFGKVKYIFNLPEDYNYEVFEYQKGRLVMYVIDYPNQKIKKFSNNELEDFLNTIIKNRWLFIKDKKKAKKVLNQITLNRKVG